MTTTDRYERGPHLQIIVDGPLLRDMGGSPWGKGERNPSLKAEELSGQRQRMREGKGNERETTLLQVYHKYYSVVSFSSSKKPPKRKVWETWWKEMVDGGQLKKIRIRRGMTTKEGRGRKSHWKDLQRHRFTVRYIYIYILIRDPGCEDQGTEVLHIVWIRVKMTTFLDKFTGQISNTSLYETNSTRDL